MTRYTKSTALLIALCALSTTTQAQRASFYQCDHCTAAEMRETAILIGEGDHHLYDIRTQTLKRYTVQGGGGTQPRTGLGSAQRQRASDATDVDANANSRASTAVAGANTGAAIVREQIPDARVLAIFRDMVAFDQLYPGVFSTVSTEEVPIGNIGLYHDGMHLRSFSPAGVGLARPVNGGPASSEYTRFIDALRTALQNSDSGLGARLAGLLGFSDRINGVSVSGPNGGMGLSWDNFHAPTYLSLCNGDGDCVVVKIDPGTREITYVGAYDTLGNEYPGRAGSNLEHTFSDPVFADEFADDLAGHGVRISRQSRGTGPRLRTSVVCMYVNGMLDGCTIIVERF